MTDTAKVMIRAVDITKSYQAVKALDRVSVDIIDGEFLTLLGPSGSGKTTFLMCLAGFVDPTSGRLEEDGEDVTRRPAEERRFGMVFQGYALFPHMSVADNVAFPLKVQKIGKAERQSRVSEILETVGLTPYKDRRPNQLSGGQQQRVALARALVSHPKMILLDEPLSALDKNLREQMQEEIKQLHKKTGATFVFVTHDQTEALSMSSRIAIFNHGRVQQIGTPEEVYETPANRFVAEFLGRINLIPLENARIADGRLSGGFEGRELVAPARTDTIEDPMIAIRPEHMTIGDVPPSDGVNGIKAKIRGRVYGGAQAILQVVTPSGHDISLDVPGQAGRTPFADGQDVWITWPQEAGFALPGKTDD